MFEILLWFQITWQLNPQTCRKLLTIN